MLEADKHAYLCAGSMRSCLQRMEAAPNWEGAKASGRRKFAEGRARHFQLCLRITYSHVCCSITVRAHARVCSVSKSGMV